MSCRGLLQSFFRFLCRGWSSARATRGFFLADLGFSSKRGSGKAGER